MELDRIYLTPKVPYIYICGSSRDRVLVKHVSRLVQLACSVLHSFCVDPTPDVPGFPFWQLPEHWACLQPGSLSLSLFLSAGLRGLPSFLPLGISQRELTSVKLVVCVGRSTPSH